MFGCHNQMQPMRTLLKLQPDHERANESNAGFLLKCFQAPAIRDHTWALHSSKEFHQTLTPRSLAGLLSHRGQAPAGRAAVPRAAVPRAAVARATVQGAHLRASSAMSGSRPPGGPPCAEPP